MIMMGHDDVNATRISGDGTFKVVPALWDSLYTLHVMLGSAKIHIKQETGLHKD